MTVAQIKPHPQRLRTHALPSQRSYILPSQSIRIFNSKDASQVEKETATSTGEFRVPPVRSMTDCSAHFSMANFT